MTPRSACPATAHQRGVALFTVLAILLFSLTVLLSMSRMSQLNEMLLGTSSDYQRTFAAAEALLRDAEIDIRGRLPPYETVRSDGSRGTACRAAAAAAPSSGASTDTSRDNASDVIGCRDRSNANAWFPQNNAEFDQVSDRVLAHNATLRCQQGICMPANLAALTTVAQNLDTWRPEGACYGQYTRQNPTSTNDESDYNPVLRARFDDAQRCTDAHGWYWVAAFRYVHATSNSPPPAGAVQPDPERSFIYRITAVATGLRDGTRVVLQSDFVPFPAQEGR